MLEHDTSDEPDGERICANCGDDLATAGLPFCMDCLEADPSLLP